jgi:hypothetical protein
MADLREDAEATRCSNKVNEPEVEFFTGLEAPEIITYKLAKGQIKGYKKFNIFDFFPEIFEK